jgi:hypothetical protein
MFTRVRFYRGCAGVLVAAALVAYLVGLADWRVLLYGAGYATLCAGDVSLYALRGLLTRRDA